MTAISPRTALLVLAALVLALAGGPPAHAKSKAGGKRADLSTASLHVAAFAHPGGALPVDVTVRARGAAAKATVTRFWLSADRKAGKGDVRLAQVKTAKLKRNGKALAAAQPVLGAATKLGRWYVLACADGTRKVRERNERDNCRAAKLTVAAKGTAPSSAQLITDAVTAGKLTAEQGLIYRVFADFGDRRLPAAYRGDAGAPADDAVIRDAAAAYATLTPKAKKQLYPFFLPPPARHSWANLPSSTLADALRTTPQNTKTKAKRKRKRSKPKKRVVTARAAQAAADEVEDEFADDPCDSEQLAGRQWDNVPTAGGKIRVWWAKGDAKLGAHAAAIAREMGGVAYPKFKAAMGRDLLSDAKVPCFHGSDGALDIYFIPNISRARAMSIPSAQTPQNNLICDGTPSFIVAEHASNRWDLAHELFHSFQYLFPLQEDCRNYLWFDEGSANWGANLAYPADNGEHEYNQLLDTRYHWSLQEQDYQSWPFALFLEKTIGTSAIKAIYEQFGKADALPAMDKAIGGFRTRWREFAKHAWNQDPIASFQSWDGVGQHPLVDYKEIEPVHLHLAGQKARTAYPRAEMERLTRQYRSYTVTDEKLRELKFVNPLAGDEDFGVQAIVTVGGAKRIEDWTGRKTVTFCRDNPEQNITELVLIYSNAKFGEGQRIDAEPNLKLRDKCDGFPYRYKVLSASFSQTTYAKSNDTYPCSRLNGISGTNEFTGASAGPQLVPENQLEKTKFGFEGQAFADVPAKWVQTLSGCEYTPTLDIIPCQTTRVDTPRPTPDWKMGFSMRADSPDAKEVTISWALSDPSVGYFDADNSVCNFTEQWVGFPHEEQQQQVPLERLASTAPQTFTFTGGPKHWNATQIGRPATIQFDWSHTITVQRVDEDGQPLE